MQVSTLGPLKFGRRICAAAAFLYVFIVGPSFAEPVDLELVIATDVSRSVNVEEATLQRDGVAQAFRSAEVIEAIERGALGKIAVVYVDWSTDYLNQVVVDWQTIHDRVSAAGFAEALIQAPPTWGRRTSISSALILAAELMETNEYEGTRRVIDISGDGPNNFGLSLAPVREDTIAKGITINGLPIIVTGAQFAGRGYFPEVDKYYQRCVIGGSGAFLVVAKGFEDFSAAIRRKLVLELSGLTPEVLPPGETIPSQTIHNRSLLIPVAAAPGGSRSLPRTPPNLPILRPPATREEDCDRWGSGFGGYNDFGRR
jgi:hypothetical protein